MKRVIWPVLLILFALTAIAQDVKNIKSVTLEEFEQKLKQTKDPQILDVRSPQEFLENHLKDAINFYAQDDEAFNKNLAGLNKNKPVFVYSINNGRSTVVSGKLREAGFTEVYPLPGGLAHWIGAGKPIVTAAGNGLTTDEFNKLFASQGVILVDIGSKHCGGCKKLEPIVEEVSKEQGLKVVKIELYDNRQLARDLNIESVPTLILYKGDKPIWRKSGAITKADLSDALEKSL